MKDYFDTVSASCSKITTRFYSTSFSLGITFLNKKFHKSIYGIYGFVRFADEIVDSFHNYDKQYLLAKFRNDTIEALELGISLNPILNSFQEIARRHTIEWELIDNFLQSMEMDLNHNEHNADSYKRYIFGSAEAVGLMCLRVFSENNIDLYEKLKPNAMKLGAAFQKVNFLRDLNADYGILGRTYFPDINFSNFSSFDKEKIQSEIESDFTEALVGIKQLPVSSRRGVYLAYYYYRKLFSKIKNTPAEKVISTRIRIPDTKKIQLMIQSFVRYQLNVL